MRFSWANLRKDGAISRETALGLLATNVAMPGFGTILAGKVVTGAMQAVLAFAGVAVSTIYGIRMIGWMFSNWERLHDPYGDPVAMLGEMWLAIRWPLAGLLCFGFAWAWSMLSSWSLLRKTRNRSGAA